jgi:hypothetical protein
VVGDREADIGMEYNVCNEDIRGTEMVGLLLNNY